MAGRGKFVAAGILVVAAVSYLIVSSTGSTASFFLTVEELKTMGDGAIGRNVTVSGAVLGDTIDYDSSVPEVAFTIVHIPGDPKEIERAGGLAAVLHEAANGPTRLSLDVVYRDAKPDMLQNEAQAIARGQLGQDGRFHADEVILKCPSRYEEEVPDQIEG
jgi:cytochrome c-type biogenesis protein CcmE